MLGAQEKASGQPDAFFKTWIYFTKNPYSD
jgi:hypothetical protein